MKLKTRKSILKRFKIKKHQFFHKKAYKSHLLRKKNSARLRALSRVEHLNKYDFSLVKTSIVA